jgi:transcriptional regulator with XRE-family HTH domain
VESLKLTCLADFQSAAADRHRGSPHRIAHALHCCNIARIRWSCIMTYDPLTNGEKIRERLRISGKTQRQLALALGIDASGVSRLLDGTRMLREEELIRIRAFFDPGAAGPAGPPVTYRLGPANDGKHSRRTRPGPSLHQRATGDIPVYTVSAGVRIYGGPVRSGEPFFELFSKAVEYRPRPLQLLGVEGASGIFAPSDAFSPRYRAGDTLYVHPTKPPAIGCDVFVRRREDNQVALLRYLGGDGASLKFSSASSVFACTAVPDDDVLVLTRETISQIGRIVLISTN